MTVLPSFDTVTYYYDCTDPGRVDYVSCSIPGHCEEGQKIRVRTSSDVRAVGEFTVEWILHVDSLERITRLMGRRSNDGDGDEPGTVILDRGYQTEALADRTMEWI
mmetsp:Transcript_29888/g.68576  ORF Transcript_29888/g.68576 Transcript_29888/m.68576 type:complete len:106 (+) Transcript_29888:330-647(+)